MIHSVNINGYRGFSRLEMGGLGWVNLLVGRNNSGKSSVLEALYILASGGDPLSIWRIASRRGERLDGETVSRNPPDQLEVDVSHLFHGHDLKVGSKFSISTKNSSPAQSIEFSVQEANPSKHPELFPDPSDASGTRFILSVVGTVPKNAATSIPLSIRGGLSSGALDSRRLRRDSASIRRSSAQYITTESLSVDELIRMWNDVVLTESEDMVLEALRYLEPGIERVASVGSSSYYYGPLGSRGGFKVKLKSMASPIPIGSLGDGTWRMLAMAIAVSRAKNGVLLIDEIDTGLHHTVLSDMWKLIYRTAKKYNVQVFATTHSYDCVQSLATVCKPNTDTSNNITIQRIEINKQKAIPFTEAEIKMAADKHIELR